MAILKRPCLRIGLVYYNHRLFDLLGFWETRTMTKSLREISQALLDNWDTPEWNKLSKRAELMAELRVALMDPTPETSSGGLESDFDASVESLERQTKADGGYLPALATLLRIKADELADKYPDDTNGGSHV